MVISTARRCFQHKTEDQAKAKQNHSLEHSDQCPEDFLYLTCLVTVSCNAPSKLTAARGR